MKYIKISNLINTQGVADYKGLDLTKIITGSQIYPDNENVAYIIYEGEIPSHQDLVEISQSEYEEIKESNRHVPPISIEDRLTALENALLQSLGI